MKLIFTTLPAAHAADVARGLLEARLIGCCNLVPAVRSLYWWDGAIQDDEEVVAFMETTQEHCAEATRRLRETHPYSVPKIVVLTPDPEFYGPDGAPGHSYAAWLSAVVAASA